MKRARRSQYIDSQGNEISRSTFESLLALKILNCPNSWKGVYRKFNKKILELLEFNKNSNPIGFSNITEKFPYENMVQILSREMKSEKEAYFNQDAFELYKHLFDGENFIKHLFILEKAALREDKRFRKDIYFRNYLETMVPQVRPLTLFSERGREKSGQEPHDTANYGILSDAASPLELKRVLYARSPPAKLEWKRKDCHPVRLMQVHGHPFVTSFSGTVGLNFLALWALLGRHLTKEEYKQFFMALAARLVLEGHHSFFEIGVVIDKIFRSAEFRSVSFAVDPTLPPHIYYLQFLADAFRLSDAFHKFFTKYHPAKYSAMTWEILRDFLLECDKLTIANEQQKSLILQIKKQCEDNFEKKRNLARRGEVDEQSLERLKEILAEYKSFQFKEKEFIQLFNKLCKKLEDSGIVIQHVSDEKDKSVRVKR